MNTKRIALALAIFLMAGLVVMVAPHPTQDAPRQPALDAATASTPLDKRAAAYERKKARAEYFFQLMRDPATNTIPDKIRQRELAYARTLPSYDAGAFKAAGALELNWREAGPNNVGGRTRGLGVDVANTQNVIAGGVTGGIWKSTDRGATWTLKTAQHLPITTLAQDPRAGQTATWYAATGEFSSTDGTVGSTKIFGSGFYKSTDNGETWQLLHGAGNPTVIDTQYDNVVKVLVSPTTGTVIMATNLLGVFRSIDGGTTFTPVLGNTPNDHAWSDVAVAANGTLAAVLSSNLNNDPKANQGVYRSTDDGATWTNITPNTFPTEHQRSVIAIAPSNPDAAYALTYDGFDDTAEAMSLHKITLSTGASIDRSANLPNFAVDDFNGIVNTQSSYNMAIAVKPDDENIVLVGGTSLFRSRDGFASAPTAAQINDVWIGGYMTDGSNGDYPNHHPDIQGLYFDPGDADFLWSVHDGGVSTLADVATNQTTVPWVDKNTTYNVTQFYHVAQAAAAGDDRIFGGTQDNGSPFFRSDGAATGASTDKTGGDGTYSHLGATYALGSTTGGALQFKTYDVNGDPVGFFQSADVTPPGAENQLFINPLAVDPVTENVVYYPDGNALWRGDLAPTINGGNEPDWTELTNVGIPAGYGLTSLTASTTPAHVLYLGASSTGDPPKIYRFDNADTATDGEVERSIAGAPNGAYVHSIAVNPTNADEILVALSNYNIVGLYHSIDGGQNYTAVEGNLEGDAQNPGPSIRAVSILPFDGTTTYLVGTSTGAYSTTALSPNTQWTQEGAGVIGNNIVEFITSRTSDGRTALATHGRGIFLGTVAGAANQPPAFTATLPDTTITAGNTLTFTYTATDPNGDNLTFALTEGPATATLDAGSGVFSWTPTAPGDSTVSVTVSDGSLTASTSATVTVVGATAVEDEELPGAFALNQNYPNPFNPGTTIAFSLAQPSAVTLTVYDLAGRTVATLVTGELKATGRHVVAFDARGLASGTYVYRLEAKPASGEGQTFVESKRMVLLK